MRNSVDPFTVEVIRHALTAAAEKSTVRWSGVGRAGAADKLHCTRCSAPVT